MKWTLVRKDAYWTFENHNGHELRILANSLERAVDKAYALLNNATIDISGWEDES